jgi:hypothetical protein
VEGKWSKRERALFGSFLVGIFILPVAAYRTILSELLAEPSVEATRPLFLIFRREDRAGSNRDLHRGASPKRMMLCFLIDPAVGIRSPENSWLELLHRRRG